MRLPNAQGGLVDSGPTEPPFLVRRALSRLRAAVASRVQAKAVAQSGFVELFVRCKEGKWLVLKQG